MDAVIERAAGPLAQRNQAEIDRELRLVDTAIAMVRRGGARRVTLACLPLGTAVLAAAQARASLHHLRVRPVSDMEDGPMALIVEPGED